MEELFAHVNGTRHNFAFTKIRKGRWNGDCDCRKMIFRTGSLLSVTQAWKEHVRLEGERYDAPVYITEI